ncbi:hypothetical protein CFC21_009047 [Triticum aestivum]|uniref:Knottin scorpion toxin-like domain-containing protein n=2 Tax=Triticum aestivum TaxID=4565 RepID=A0A3B5Z5Q2_WHEAT|nr:hypothetical protein CFC21_009047 [Triticum aestivum]
MGLLKDMRALLLVAIVVTAMVMSSCHAAQDIAAEGPSGSGECNQILPCTDNTCKINCQKLGFKNPKTQCRPGNPKKGQFYDTCCCF